MRDPIEVSTDRCTLTILKGRYRYIADEITEEEIANLRALIAVTHQEKRNHYNDLNATWVSDEARLEFVRHFKLDLPESEAIDDQLNDDLDRINISRADSAEASNFVLNQIYDRGLDIKDWWYIELFGELRRKVQTRIFNAKNLDEGLIEVQQEHKAKFIGHVTEDELILPTTSFRKSSAWGSVPFLVNERRAAFLARMWGYKLSRLPHLIVDQRFR